MLEPRERKARVIGAIVLVAVGILLLALGVELLRIQRSPACQAGDCFLGPSIIIVTVIGATFLGFGLFRARIFSRKRQSEAKIR